MEKLLEVAETLQQQFKEQISCQVALAELTIETKASSLLALCQTLQEEPYSCKQLVDLSGIDYLHYPQDAKAPKGQHRFAVVYHLLSHKNNQRIRLRCYCEHEPPQLPSVVKLWSVANWYEREVFDLFGITFDGHPDLRRLLTTDDFAGHPLRKDFPLVGNVEMRYDATKQQVVTEPVSIKAKEIISRVSCDNCTRFKDRIE